MALAKERTAQDSLTGLIQACSFYGNVYGGPLIQVPDPSLGFFGFDNYQKAVLEEGESSRKTCGSLKNFALSRLPSLSDPTDLNNNALVFGSTNSPPEETQSVLSFKSGYDNWVYSSSSLLNFEQGERVSLGGYSKLDHEDDYSIWGDAMDHSHQWNHFNSKCGLDSRLSQDMNCFETASGCGSLENASKDDQHGKDQIGWLFSEDSLQESGGSEGSFHKRPFKGFDEHGMTKKHCAGPTKKHKPKPIPSKDPQSIAAKNRRERISERLKILQDLVPNGTKVDLVTMLEKAISYVKFLQLQVKVLATDEFWPAQGGKAPEITQVKEAIDAILSSHRDINSCSK